MNSYYNARNDSDFRKKLDRDRERERELCLYFFFFTTHNLLFDNTHQPIIQPLIHISLQFTIERSR